MNEQVMPQQRMLDLLTGYWVTQLISAFARLGLADVLAAGPGTAAELAAAVDADAAALERLLRAAAAQQLVTVESGGRYRLTALGGTLRTGRLGSLRDYAITMGAPAHWQSWGRLTEAVRAGAPALGTVFGEDLWRYYAARSEEAASFSRAMGELSQLVAMDLVNIYDCADSSRIVDIGGARGILLAAMLQRAPQARGVLLDRADVVAAAAAALPPGLRPRVECVAGDFFTAVPARGDLYLLKQILHDYDDADGLRILRAVHTAAAPRARLLIVEMPLPEPGEPSPAWLVDLNMLVLLGGRERTVAQYRALLDAAGFELMRTLPLRGGFAVIEALRR